MPKDFLECVREKGRVRTIKPNPSEYLYICYKDGKSYHGEVKKTKTGKKRDIIKKRVSKVKKK
jgi:hypothetical protein